MDGADVVSAQQIEEAAADAQFRALTVVEPAEAPEGPIQRRLKPFRLADARFPPETVDAENAALSKKGLQRRAKLDLVLCLGDEAVADGIASTDGLGNLLEDSLWQPATLPEGLANCTLEFVDLDAPYYTLLSDEGLVPVHVIYPEGYDANRAEPYPVVNYQCGGGVCYWEVSDGTVSGGAKAEETNANNLGCNTVYDTQTSSVLIVMSSAMERTLPL